MQHEPQIVAQGKNGVEEANDAQVVASNLDSLKIDANSIPSSDKASALKFSKTLFEKNLDLKTPELSLYFDIMVVKSGINPPRDLDISKVLALLESDLRILSCHIELA